MSNRNILQALQSAGGATGGAPLDVDDVFSTYLYEGNGSTQTITNGIDLTEGGLVWSKDRDTATYHSLTDTVRGGQYALYSSATDAQVDRGTDFITSFNSNGYSLGADGLVNDTNSYVSWTFRKAKKFFDVVEFSTGGSAVEQTINHSLGSTPGMIIIKDLHIGSWYVWHRSIGTTQYLRLEATDAVATYDGVINNVTSTSFTTDVGTAIPINSTAIAYLFAHNDGDGEFGPDGDQDIIKCGAFTSDSNGLKTVNLGFEPQWLLFKGYHAGSSWFIVDVMRGMTNGDNDAWLAANLTNAEGTSNTVVTPTATGFVTDGTNIVDPSSTFIYMAIRRGPLAVPEDATDVFSVNEHTAGNVVGGNIHNVGFVPDMNINTRTVGSTNYLLTRLMGTYYLRTDVTVAQAKLNGTKYFTSSTGTIDLDTSWWGGANNVISWTWKRAPGYFDVVAYTGTGAAGRTVNHNLGVAPEMMWVKRRNTAGDQWPVYHHGFGNSQNQGNYYVLLDDTTAQVTNSSIWNNTKPTSSVFSVGNSSTVNASSSTYIAYLFASAPGVSKVGSYTGNGSSQNIDCGFSNGARFVLIKGIDTTFSWYLHDTARGIVSGNDPYLQLNNTDSEQDANDIIDPYSPGFSLANGFGGWNKSGSTYIFYAIA